MSNIKLLATDLDGTLIGSPSDFHLYDELKARIGKLRERDDAVWAICTGRSMTQCRSFLDPMRLVGLVPDYIVLRHAYIYGRTRLGYFPHFIWNISILYKLWMDSLRIKDAISEWSTMVTGGTRGVRQIIRQSSVIEFHFDSAEHASAMESLLREKANPLKHLRVYRKKNSVHVRLVPYTKGLALSALANHIGAPDGSILAIGDGHNDVSMLDGTFPNMTGCPANAEPEVKLAVHESGGHIARTKAIAGVLEIIDAYESGKVDSTIPDTGEIVTLTPEARIGRARRKSIKQRRKKRNIFLFAGLGYIVLLVFASVGMLPFVSGLVMKPYLLLLALIEKIVSLL